MSEPERIDLPKKDADKLLARLAAGKLNTKDYELLEHILKNWIWLSGAFRSSRLSIKELKKLIFGSKTEKTEKVLKEKKEKLAPSKPKEKQKGHGRNGADDYPDAKRIPVAQTDTKADDRCLSCRPSSPFGATPGRAKENSTFCHRAKSYVSAVRRRFKLKSMNWKDFAAPHVGRSPQRRPHRRRRCRNTIRVPSR